MTFGQAERGEKPSYEMTFLQLFGKAPEPGYKLVAESAYLGAAGGSLQHAYALLVANWLMKCSRSFRTMTRPKAGREVFRAAPEAAA